MFFLKKVIVSSHSSWLWGSSCPSLPRLSWALHGLLRLPRCQSWFAWQSEKQRLLATENLYERKREEQKRKRGLQKASVVGGAHCFQQLPPLRRQGPLEGWVPCQEQTLQPLPMPTWWLMKNNVLVMMASWCPSSRMACSRNGRWGWEQKTATFTSWMDWKTSSVFVNIQRVIFPWDCFAREFQMHDSQRKHTSRSKNGTQHFYRVLREALETGFSVSRSLKNECEGSGDLGPDGTGIIDTGASKSVIGETLWVRCCNPFMKIIDLKWNGILLRLSFVLVTMAFFEVLVLCLFLLETCGWKLRSLVKGSTPFLISNAVLHSLHADLLVSQSCLRVPTWKKDVKLNRNSRVCSLSNCRNYWRQQGHR